MSEKKAEPLQIDPPTILLQKAPCQSHSNTLTREAVQKDMHWTYGDQEVANRYYKFLFADYNAHCYMIDDDENLKIINGDDLSPKDKILFQTFKKNIEKNINQSIAQGFIKILDSFAANHEHFHLDSDNNLVIKNG